jgi:hypothetical protein
MKPFLLSVPRRSRWFELSTPAVAVIAAVLITLIPSCAKDAQAKKTVAPPAKTSPLKKLSGSDLYAMHCNRCHPERYAPERTSAQWQTILLHMRTRANLPAEQARAILKFLQEDSGS